MVILTLGCQLRRSKIGNSPLQHHISHIHSRVSCKEAVVCGVTVSCKEALGYGVIVNCKARGLPNMPFVKVTNFFDANMQYIVMPFAGEIVLIIKLPSLMAD